MRFSVGLRGRVGCGVKQLIVKPSTCSKHLVEVPRLDLRHVEALVDEDRRAFMHAWERWESEPTSGVERRYRFNLPREQISVVLACG
jgi:hypothetical protein